MKKPFFILLYLICSLGFSQKTSDYFPFDKNITWYYDCRFNDRETGELKIMYDSTSLKRYNVNETIWYYWQQNPEDQYVATNIFLWGAARLQNDSLFMAVLDDEDEIPEISDENTYLLFPDVLKKGYSVKLNYGDGNTITFTVAGTETIKIQGKTYKNCIRIEIEDIWESSPDSKEKYGTVWLFKGIGVVKWIRVTGRVEELVKYQVHYSDSIADDGFIYMNQEGYKKKSSELSNDIKFNSDFSRAVYNEKGWLTEEFYWENTRYMDVSNIKYEYDETGKLLRETLFYDDDEERISEFEYDKKGRLIFYKSKMHKEDTRYFVTYYFKYDFSKNLYGKGEEYDKIQCTKPFESMDTIVSDLLFSKIHPLKK